MCQEVMEIVDTMYKYEMRIYLSKNALNLEE